jgi:hypothetical protein
LSEMSKLVGEMGDHGVFEEDEEGGDEEKVLENCREQRLRVSALHRGGER